MTMKLRDYKRKAKEEIYNGSGKWSWLAWFIKTKECHYILLAIFIIIILIMFTNPEIIMKFKIAFWNWLLGKLK
jgi:hypothetical protein